MGRVPLLWFNLEKEQHTIFLSLLVSAAMSYRSPFQSIKAPKCRSLCLHFSPQAAVATSSDAGFLRFLAYGCRASQFLQSKFESSSYLRLSKRLIFGGWDRLLSCSCMPRLLSPWCICSSYRFHKAYSRRLGFFGLSEPGFAKFPLSHPPHLFSLGGKVDGPFGQRDQRLLAALLSRTLVRLMFESSAGSFAILPGSQCCMSKVWEGIPCVAFPDQPADWPSPWRL
jgi:hypothetical protein